jgi:hypothetical protein
MQHAPVRSQRAGFNFNDGMGGGNLLDSNLIFNMVRETQDHGTFNSWNRQVTNATAGLEDCAPCIP